LSGRRDGKNKVGRRERAGTLEDGLFLGLGEDGLADVDAVDVCEDFALIFRRIIDYFISLNK
jgi:hypothetical protein